MYTHVHNVHEKMKEFSCHHTKAISHYESARNTAFPRSDAPPTITQEGEANSLRQATVRWQHLLFVSRDMHLHTFLLHTTMILLFTHRVH